jgi:NADH-quinone oxidoreductase subunit E
MTYDDATSATLAKDSAAIMARYPVARSGLLPMLHLVQSLDGYVSPNGIQFCADQLGLTAAEVSAVATFYTQYKRRPNGEYQVGVCTNTLCAVLGGDEIWRRVSEHIGIGHDETNQSGKITLERIECNAACDYGPVMMVNWEFFDNMTPDKALQLVDDILAGKEVKPSRGAHTVASFKDVSRVLAGFSDDRADEDQGVGAPSLAGLRVARGETEPVKPALEAATEDNAKTAAKTADKTAAKAKPKSKAAPTAAVKAKQKPASGRGKK